MLSAEHINIILDCLYRSLREKIPNLRFPSLGAIEVVGAVGVHGSVVFGSLLTGDLDVKMTVAIDWETAIKLATTITKIDKADAFDQPLMDALEGVVNDTWEKVTAHYSQMGVQCEILPLPTMIDGNVLLGAHPDPLTIKIPIRTDWQPIDLYLSFPRPAKQSPKCQDAAPGPAPDEEKPDAA